MVGDISHVCNRGVDKRKIFLGLNDYSRFVDNLLLLNNKEGKIRTKYKNPLDHVNSLPKGKKLVEILKWSLLPNHYHLLLYEATEGGILEFTKRLGNAYTKYFNLKHQGRSGYLFQNRAKIISLESEGHIPYIPIYIDLNARDLAHGSPKKVMEFLKSYEWSSLKDYFENSNRELIINKTMFYKLFETNPVSYFKDLEGFLEDKVEITKFQGMS
jgi:putative transposase